MLRLYEAKHYEDVEEIDAIAANVRNLQSSNKLATNPACLFNNSHRDSSRVSHDHQHYESEDVITACTT